MWTICLRKLIFVVIHLLIDLIIVVTRLPIQAHIQACIDVSKVVSAHIYWVCFYAVIKASWAPIGAHPSSPDVHPLMQVCAHPDGSAPVQKMRQARSHISVQVWSALSCDYMLSNKIVQIVPRSHVKDRHCK